MSPDVSRFFKDLGFSEKEKDVYMYLLPVESATPIEIAKEVGLKRSTVYVILENLKEKGLVREIERGKRHAYVSEEPERIAFLLQEAKLRTEGSLEELKTVLPQLKAIVRKVGQPPLIRFFEGQEAVQNSMEEMANNPRFREERDYGVFPLELIYKLFRTRNLRQYVDLRLKQNKQFDVLYTSEEGEIKTMDGQKAIRIDQKEFPLSCDISIFEDEVRIHILGKTIYGISIKNLEFAETLVSILKLAERGASIKK